MHAYGSSNNPERMYVYMCVCLRPLNIIEELVIFNNLSGDRINVVADLTTENNTESEKKKEERREDVQKESTLQPVTKANTKLDKELQDWEVDSTMSG